MTVLPQGAPGPHLEALRVAARVAEYLSPTPPLHLPRSPYASPPSAQERLTPTLTTPFSLEEGVRRLRELWRALISCNSQHYY